MTAVKIAGAQTECFAEALREAVAASGLGLESIRRRLAARKVNVSVATLSCWQSGTRAPGRRGSEEVVAHLEAVLGLRPRSLRVLMPAPRPRGRVPVQRSAPMPPHFAERDAVRRIAERVQQSWQPTRLSEHDVVVVGADRRIELLRATMVLRADLPGIRRLGFTQFFDDPTAGMPRLQLLTGGEVVERHADVAHRTIGTVVDFGHELQRGETVLVEFEVTADGPGPRDRTYDSSFGSTVREMTMQVRFDPSDPPTWCESYQRQFDEGGSEVRRRVEMSVLGHAHTVALECPTGTIGMAWDWA